MNLDDFSYEENGRRYIDPNVSLGEQNAFIQNLRDTQGERNAQIAQQTHNLGTDVPSNLGGLTGSEAYFNARYQTPQTNSVVADLRSAAQASALNTVMSNELAKAKKRYQDAYNAAQKRANGGNTGDTTTDGEVKFETVGDGNEYQLKYKSTEGGSGYEDSWEAKHSKNNLHWRNKAGDRVPISIIWGTDGTKYVKTPTVVYEGQGIAKYAQKMRDQGYTLYMTDSDGRVSAWTWGL